MPIAVQADWDLIQQLYNNGLPLKKISEQTNVQVGTIASRASRYGWKVVAQKAKQVMQAASVEVKIESPQTESNALSKASALVREKLSNELLRAVDTLTSTKPSKRLETQLRRASVMQTITGAAKVIHGWSEGQSSPSVRIAIMGSTTVQVEEPAQQPAIDVTPPDC